MKPNRSIIFAAAAALTLAFPAAAVHAQAGAVATARPSDQAGAQPTSQPAETPKPPLFLKQGDAPSATDPIPAPSSPLSQSEQTARSQSPNSPTDTITAPGSNTPRTWTTDQILTATVHQAWILSGKDESNFFEIVKELAAISAANRNLTIPDSPDAGKKAGAYIRAQSKEDHDQLLYDIVDKAVRMTGTKSTANSAGPTSSPATTHPAR